MNNVIPIIFILSVILFEPLLSNTTLSIRDRKKNIDNRLKVVKEIDSAFGGLNFNRSQERMDSIKAKAEEFIREKSDKEKARLFSYLEEDLHSLQIDYSNHLEKVSDELIELFSKEYFLKNDWKSLNDLGKKERIQKYFEMAKKERIQGQNYHRMKNPQLAILSYKRSIIYNFHSFRLTDTELPSHYQMVYEKWMKDYPLKNSGTLAEDKPHLERNEN